MGAVRIADMFCGAGLFSQGFLAAGAEPVFAADLAPDAIATYNRNVAHVAQNVPVSSTLELPTVDLVIAGPPCQGFSTLGSQDPADARNILCLCLPDLIARSGALMAVVENVPPFLESRFWSSMVDDFEARGFAVTSWTLDAVDYGAPQRRSRSFTIASKIGLPVRPEKAPKQFLAGEVFHNISVGDPMHVWPEPTPLAKTRMALIPPLGDKRNIMRAAPELCPSSWFRMGAQATDVWGRIDPLAPSNTLRCRFQNPSTGRYIHPTEDRVISLREGARLQGVPDSWQFVGTSQSIARQIGNGVPIHLATAVAESVLGAFHSAEALAA